MPVPPHPISLFNLKDDPGERVNLAEEMPGKLEEMKAKMDSARAAMGELPPSLDIGLAQDHSHYEYLNEKHGGEKYWFKEYKK